MSGGIKIGFSMHPRWANAPGLEAFVAPLRQAGLGVLEFELDSHLDQWPEFQGLMKRAVELGLDLSFHAPYRAPYNLAGFCGDRRAAIEADYSPMLAIAEGWGQRLPGLRTVVVHATTARLPAELADLIRDTRAFLEWALTAFPHLLFALENNSPAGPGVLKAGDGRAAVLNVLEGLPSDPRLRVCWDMGHDTLGNAPAEPGPEWLGRVAHVHVHDVDERGADHYPLIYGRVPFRRWLARLKEANMQGAVILELKGGNLRGWPLEKIENALVSSIALIAEEVK